MHQSALFISYVYVKYCVIMLQFTVLYNVLLPVNGI